MTEARLYLSCFSAGLLIGAFATYIWLFYQYVGTRRSLPDISRGFVYPLNNHGSYHYLNAADAMGMRLNSWIFEPMLLLLIIVIPKDKVVRKVTGAGKGFKTERREPSRRNFAFLWLIALVYLCATFIFGKSLVNLALQAGVAPN
jgi:hypothetical protein